MKTLEIPNNLKEYVDAQIRLKEELGISGDEWNKYVIPVLELEGKIERIRWCNKIEEWRKEFFSLCNADGEWIGGKKYGSFEDFFVSKTDKLLGDKK